MHPAQTYKYTNPSDFAVFGMVVTIIGLIYSPFLLSVGMWLLAVAAVRHQFMNTAFERWNTMRPMSELFLLTCKRIWSNYAAQPVYWVLSALFLVPALSGLWSEELAFWCTNTRVRIPFVTLPLTFANLPAFNARQVRLIGATLVGVVAVTCVGVGINFWMHQDEMLQLLKTGKHIPVPRSHIRFSLSVAFAVLVAIHSRSIWGRGLALILFLFLHFLSVRSGIVAMYVGLVVYFLHGAVMQRRWGGLLGLFVGIALMSVLAVRLFPSLAMKLSYQKFDQEQYNEAHAGDYSDSGRMASIEAGWQIVKDEMLIGVGTGDLPKATKAYTLSNHPAWKPEQVKLPHNQWLFIWASTGLLGLIASLVGILYWLRLKATRRSALFVGFQAIALTSLIVEYTFETSIGVAFFLVNYCLLVKLALHSPEEV